MSGHWRNGLALLAAATIAVPIAAPARADATAKTHRLDRFVTAAIPGTATFADDVGARDLTRLKLGLDAIDAGDIAGARAARDAMDAGSLDRHVLAWAIAVRGGAKVPSSEIAAAAQALPGWPGMETLRRNSERALFRENPPPQVVVNAFGGTPPQTSAGAIILARSYLALDKRDEAQKMLGAFWRMAKLEVREEAAILQEFSGVIEKADHRFRMERMLYAERIRSAERVASYAGAEALEKAWAAVLRDDKDAPKLLAAVPRDQHSAGYYFAQAKQYRREGEERKAVEVMVRAPTDRAALVDPDAWWVERRVLSRELMDAGEIKDAYRVAAAHAAESTASAVDAEFHAGWYALRGLNDARTAARHFSRIAELADGPISRSRAYYWLGRAAEAGGPGDAKAYFSKAAAYGTTFYGQLAAQRIGLAAIPIPYPEPNDADRRDFKRREAVQAIDRLEEADQPTLAGRLYRDLADQLTSPGELALLAAKAAKRGNHFLALKVGKAAANRGLDIGALAHPVGAIPLSANIDGAGKALAYAIARQESEFNIGAVSGAGARGLLQLLPGTAKDIAGRMGLPYSQTRLTSDAGYNATLGAAFLYQQLGRFKGSYILTFAGYNAGPSRAVQWIKRYGDPRGRDIDAVVDWIERIPFTETRSYVQRVMENYQVYKMRLTGKYDIVDDLTNGRS